MRITSWAELGSCACLGLPVVLGHNHFGGGHAELVLAPPAGGKVKLGNSWGEYGDKGDGVHWISASTAKQGLGIYTAVCLRTVRLTAPAAAGGLGAS